ncbi:hypothetical protein L332_03665 [Agrococcus pavilionensis RW1]|uniref:Uncharacterized protein n=1 Tax=Agrococcus pavilionensis RW1 TaxID=1330458 RepID=U1LMH6_9MICO|nr:hypothetical protein [Agrococcus pavilionensis]ERG63549.1 hypothetical protein L332_03665 [Agrococcus pavilionensis RW1]
MPILTTAPLIGAAGRPVAGRVQIAATEEFDTGSEVVTVAPQAGVVRDGLFYDATGSAPLELEATPLGVGMRIDLFLWEPESGDRETTRISRVVVVPAGSSVQWSALENFVAPTGGA